jgi:hypothetical protein
MIASKPGRNRLIVYVFPSVNFAAGCAAGMDSEQEYVIIVPTEKTPAPFIQFCRDKTDELSGKKVQIWVIDHERGTVNPFLGFTHDDDVYGSFENATFAARACRLYGVNQEFWVRSG